MKFLKKATFVLFCILSSGFAFSQTRIKIASVAPSRSSWDVEQRRIAKEWSEVTGGQVILQFMNADAMGGEDGVVKKLNSVRPGQKAPIGGAVFTSLGISSIAPETHILTLCVPFMFRSQDEVNATLKEISPKMITPLNDKGYEVLGWFNVGWAYFFTKAPAPTPADLKKQRLVVGGLTSPDLVNAFKSAGYLTIDVPDDKILSSMKSPGGVEGLFTIPMYSYAAQYCRTLTYALNEPLCPVMVTFIISKEEWAAIPDQHKLALRACIKRAEDAFVADQVKNDKEYLQRCVDTGCTLVTPTAAQHALWEDDFQKSMSTASSAVIDRELYKEITSFLKTYRGE